VVGLDILPHDGPHLADVFQTDLADPTAIAGTMARVGPVDVLVNNAAVLTQVDFDDVTPDVIDVTMAVNFRAPVLLSQGVLPHMRDAGWGRIVNISSIGARHGGRPPSSMYAASKAALLSLTRYLAQYNGQHGITVNAIAPGGISTAMASPVASPESLAQIPLRRRAEPGEVASVVSFLVGDDASYVNGVTLDVNGGRLMV
jgi:NAD(P)-dependent dehydrogenase (short-subunit alcohol dehydrogenase family)